MADVLPPEVQQILEGQIDFEGQRSAELLTTSLLAASGLVAYIVGLVKQDIYLSLYTGLAGTALTFLIVVPPWPFFNKHPVKWLPARNASAGDGIVVDGKKVS
ncbi:MAG: hypothetical protein M1833_001460 [Piccolia ochrophora]|nr:MAG: hypothetical protein M1833_001460 [Piccolia ochrophora]